MEKFQWKTQVQSYDNRRDLIILSSAEETALFCAKQFLAIAADAIEKRGFFTVAFSGGHTPTAIFKEISKPEYAQCLDWTKVFCFCLLTSNIVERQFHAEIVRRSLHFNLNEKNS